MPDKSITFDPATLTVDAEGVEQLCDLATHYSMMNACVSDALTLTSKHGGREAYLEAVLRMALRDAHAIIWRGEG